MRLFGELCTSGKFVFFFFKMPCLNINIIYLLYVLIICIYVQYTNLNLYKSRLKFLFYFSGREGIVLFMFY